MSSIVNRTQYESGALLIIPNRHFQTVLDIPSEVLAAAALESRTTRIRIQDRNFQPDSQGGRMQSAEMPEGRFCDLVMKGGITSGVVYPPAIWELAQHYRFKNIGGTSAGAIAAAAAAAAEYHRRTRGTAAGFETLKNLPSELGKLGSGGQTRLLRLFQPDPPCRRLFTILVTALNARGTFRRIGLVLRGCLEGYWIAAILSIIATALFALACGSVLAGAPFLLLSAVTFIGLGIYYDVTRGVVHNNYGLCKGLTTQPKNGPALTNWLHTLIQDTAGLPHDKPLTFGDLWYAGCPAPVRTQSHDKEDKSLRAVNLQMFTTNLSHGRPYVFPHSEPTARLFFRPEEMREYLPAEVMSWIMSKSIEYQPSQSSPHSDPPVTDTSVRGLREIPKAADFPVLLATRMSLSFPVLFSAVPLWAIDYEARPGERKAERCLFSDGGISSNFPIHLFDGLLPSWPTFGIELEPALTELPDSLIFLPHAYGQGIADTWNRFDQKREAPSKFGGFLSSIVATMQNWNDTTLARSAGVRDRVVRLRLQPDEGGLNLNMPKPLIDEIATRGQQAARLLLHRFLPDTSRPPQPAARQSERANLLPSANGRGWQGWDFQRWVRMDVLISTLSAKASGLVRALGDAPYATSYRDLLAASLSRPPPGHPAPLNRAQVQALSELLTALEKVSREFDDKAPEYADQAIPEAEIRVGPLL